MNGWLILLTACLAGSLISLVGGVYLLYGKRGTQVMRSMAVPFAAGALLAAAFLDVLPEAIEGGDARQVLMACLIGLLIFFVLERSISWLHHHHSDDEPEDHARHNVWLIVIGNTQHNFLDGLALGAAFLVSPAVGVVTTIAVAMHEIPRELGDFGLMLSKGMSKRTVLIVNIVSALAAVVGAALVYGLGDYLPIPESILLAVTAGFFIYIATSDIIPGIHIEKERRVANMQTIVLIAGVIMIGVLIQAVESFVPHESHSASQEDAHIH